MKFNPYSWSDSSSPKGSKSITKTQVFLHRTIPSLFPHYFCQNIQGEKEITHLAIGIPFLGGGGEGVKSGIR